MTSIFFRIAILYFLNSITFMVQDFQQQDIWRKPGYVTTPSLGNILNAFLLMPFIPFMFYIRNLRAGRLGDDQKVTFYVYMFLTLAIYGVAITQFSFGTVFGFVAALYILRSFFEQERTRDRNK